MLVHIFEGVLVHFVHEANKRRRKMIFVANVGGYAKNADVDIGSGSPLVHLRKHFMMFAFQGSKPISILPNYIESEIWPVSFIYVSRCIAHKYHLTTTLHEDSPPVPENGSLKELPSDKQ